MQLPDLNYLLHAQPGGLLHVLLAEMHESPQALPVLHILQHVRAGGLVGCTTTGAGVSVGRKIAGMTVLVGRGVRVGARVRVGPSVRVGALVNKRVAVAMAVCAVATLYDFCQNLWVEVLPIDKNY